MDKRKRKEDRIFRVRTAVYPCSEWPKRWKLVYRWEEPIELCSHTIGLSSYDGRKLEEIALPLQTGNKWSVTAWYAHWNKLATDLFTLVFLVELAVDLHHLCVGAGLD